MSIMTNAANNNGSIPEQAPIIVIGKTAIANTAFPTPKISFKTKLKTIDKIDAVKINTNNVNIFSTLLLFI